MKPFQILNETKMHLLNLFGTTKEKKEGKIKMINPIEGAAFVLLLCSVINGILIYKLFKFNKIMKEQLEKVKKVTRIK